MTAKKKARSHHAPPKKTGKRGIGPLDPEKGFETVTKREAQGELLEIPESERPPSVQNGKCMAHFVRFLTDKNKDGKKLALMDFSFPLEDSHEGELPREVEDAWKWMRKGNVKSVVANGIEPQTIWLSIVPDGKVDLELVAVEIGKASLSLIQEKGKGKAKKVVRLQFRVVTDLDKEVARFCENNYDEFCWLRMRDTQGRLEA